MDDIERVTSADFVPTDCEDLLFLLHPTWKFSEFFFSADILRARLRTVGIEEQHFKLDRRS